MGLGEDLRCTTNIVEPTLSQDIGKADSKLTVEHKQIKTIDEPLFSLIAHPCTKDDGVDRRLERTDFFCRVGPMFISLTIVRCNIANVNLIWAPRLRLDYGPVWIDASQASSRPGSHPGPRRLKSDACEPHLRQARFPGTNPNRPYMHIARGPCSMQTPPQFECATKSYVRVCLSGRPSGTGPPAAAAHVYLPGRDLGLGSAVLKAPAGLHQKK